MKEEIVDNTISYTKASAWKMLAFLCVFIIVGVAAIIKFDSYFTDFWKIRHCKPDGYAKGDFMTACPGIKVDRYSFGSIYLDSQKNAVTNAKTADVIVFGNSRTMRSFSTNAMDDYFKSKGLTYVIFALEGASFASALKTTEKLGLKPKIVMTNTEILYTNVVGDAFGDLVYFPDKYKTRFDFFHAAQSVQKWACKSGIQPLENYYCKGSRTAQWRSAVTGRFKWELVAEPEKNIIFSPRKEKKSPSLRVEQVLPNAREFLGTSNFKKSCHVLYLVNSPNSEPNLQEALAKKVGALPVYKPFNDLRSYDKSHLDRPSSERWGSAFVKNLDPAIDKCLAGDGRYKTEPKPEKFDLKTADIKGTSDFETWRTRFMMTVEDAATKAPDGTMTADLLQTSETANARLYKSFRETPIKAGTKMRFAGWFWSEDEDIRVRLQILRGCSAENKVESSRKGYTLTKEPQRLEIEHLFEYDQKCGLVLLSVNQPNVSLNAWQGRVEYDVASAP